LSTGAAGAGAPAAPSAAGADSPRQRWAVALDFVGASANALPAGENRTPAVLVYCGYIGGGHNDYG
jgi:hypothetical protein